jgi:heme A synthase
MLGFFIRLHFNMFFVLVSAGSLCAIWGLVLLVMSRARGGKAAPLAGQEGAEAPGTSQKPTSAEAAEAPTQDGQARGTEGQPSAAQAASSKSAIPPLYRSALNVTAGLCLIQAALGGLLVALGGRPADNLHYVYGILVLVAIPVAYTYASGKIEHSRRDLLFLVIAAVVVAAAAVRAYATGQP